MPRKVDHDTRRRELVKASWEVIARDGLHGVTLRKVAAAAGCTTGRIAHYFSGRQELLLSALRAAHAAAGARMSRIAQSEAGAERLRKVVYEGLPLDAKRLEEWKVWIAFWAAAASDPELAREHALRYREWERLLSRLIGEITTVGDADARALDLVSLIDGLGIRAALVPSAGNRRLARTTIDAWVANLY